LTQTFERERERCRVWLPADSLAKPEGVSSRECCVVLGKEIIDVGSAVFVGHCQHQVCAGELSPAGIAENGQTPPVLKA